MTADPNPVILEKVAPPTTAKSEVTGEDYPIASALKAYNMFMRDGKPVKEIALAVGIPEIVICEWSAKNEWSKRRAKYAQEAVRQLDIEAAREQAEQRLETIKQQTAKAKEIVAKAHAMAMGAGTAKQLKDATDAMASAGAMEVRAVGLAEKTVTREVGADEDQRGQGARMVFIGIGAAAPVPTPAEQPKPAIETESSEVPSGS